MKKIIYSCLALTLAACGEQSYKSANSLAYNDFESVDGWLAGAQVPSLTKEKAHSGSYSVKVSVGNDFSMGYNNLLGKISSGRLRKVKVQGWVFLPDDKTNAVLVTVLADVKNPQANKTILWEGINLLKAANSYNKWVKVEKEIVIPETATASDQMLVYLWRNDSAQPAYLDDLEISRIE
ncbi:carbohydrate binding domain-containing protein [Hymenobacter terrenus]|uniref:carbohydrate binding domain-containing protein n=1 Tax=Hymenobacter terrenus TaxID=1629124 RepID=UPI000619193C|nr:carbohydrate binding domain-containing protein [Hymenobacter terrenus]